MLVPGEMERVADLIYSALLEADAATYNDRPINLRRLAAATALEIMNGEA